MVLRMQPGEAMRFETMCSKGACIVFAGMLVATSIPEISAQTASPFLCSASTRVQQPGRFVDKDGDGLDDQTEQELANRFAPIVLLEFDESNYPVNVEWFLERAHLQYHEDCTSDKDINIGPRPLLTQQALLGPPYTEEAWCGMGDTGYSHPPHRRISTVATDPDGQISAGTASTGYSDQQTFVIPDLADSDRVGSLNPRDWKTYFHAYPANDGGVMLQYWHLFAYNQLSVAGLGNHGGDWDTAVQVHLGPDLQVKNVWFSRHADDHPGTSFARDQVKLIDGTHVLVAVDGGGHAAYASPEDFCFHHSAAGGRIAWPFDPNASLYPEGLGTVSGCTLTPLAPLYGTVGGTIWQTWDGGTVASSRNLTHPVLSPNGHGGMVNLGEYNPCTSATCNGSRQASTLLAGQFCPLNDQVFIAYEGRWGNLPGGVDPPRGPVFQGFVDNGQGFGGVWNGKFNVYTAWYNEGSDQPTNPSPSKYLAATVPATLTPGQRYPVSITLLNTGSATWTAESRYSLGSQNPQDNNIWQTSGRIALPGPVLPGSAVVFNFQITAPSSTGTYNFQWRMVQDRVEWFGDSTPNFTIVVESAECPGLRANIQSDRDRIAALVEEFNSLDIKFPGDRLLMQEIRGEITSLEAEIQRLQNREAVIGCGT